jgi:hypothetical protein
VVTYSNSASAKFEVFGVSRLIFPGGTGGNDSIAVEASPYGDPATSITLDASAPAGLAANVSVSVDGSKTTVGFDSTQRLAALSLTGGASVHMSSVTAVTGAARTPDNHYVLVVNSLTIDRYSRLDLNDNDLLIHTGSHDAGETELSTVQQYLLTGSGTPAGTYVNGVNWSGIDGLTSSAAAAQFTANHNTEVTALGYALSDDLTYPISTFDGETTQAGDVLVKYTYTGDAALDGTVNGDSVNLLSGHYGTSGNTWATAAFEFDGVTGGDSVNIISGAYGRGSVGNDQFPPL